MNVVYLLLGSNLNDRETSLADARKNIAGVIGKITASSSIYETEPWGFSAENSFLNQVVRVETNQQPEQLLHEILKIETSLGRIRNFSGEYASRIIDIDILFYNDEIISLDNLIIPHPKIPERMFTLLPLSELNRSMIHPGFNKSIQELIEECSDQSIVLNYQPARSS